MSVLERCLQRCNLTLARLPGTSGYHDGQVNILSCLPDWESCLATKLGIFKFMFSLSDKISIVHVLDSNFVFLWATARSEAEYNIAI
jgi:hypothetical protein